MQKQYLQLGARSAGDSHKHRPCVGNSSVLRTSERAELLCLKVSESQLHSASESKNKINVLAPGIGRRARRLRGRWTCGWHRGHGACDETMPAAMRRLQMLVEDRLREAKF